MHNSFLSNLNKLKLKKEYIIFSVLHGIASLIVPFTTQYLVNQLALSGILLNTVTVTLVVGFFLVLTQVFKYCQVILNEYLQREVFMNEVKLWTKNSPNSKAPYFLEIWNQMKSFSIAFTHLMELSLTLFFGLIVILLFHPYFLVFLFIFLLAFWAVFRSWDVAISTSVEESDEKYNLLYQKIENNELSDRDIDRFLEKRNKHFFFIKRNKILVGITYILSQLYLIGVGIYLIQIDELSIGQLVSAEIILSGILLSLSKFPKTLESIYDYETSQIKINYALKGGHND